MVTKIFDGLFGRRGLLCAAFILMGILVMQNYVRDKNAMAQGVTDFNEMRSDDFISGRYVEGTVYDLIDEFAYEQEYHRTLGIKHGERVAAHYYILPLRATAEDERPKFAALCIENAELADKAQQMLDEYWSYLETGEEPAAWTEIHITGKISPLGGEVEKYFYEWFSAMDENWTRADIDPMVCPYVITYNEGGASSLSLLLGIVMIAVGVIGCAKAVIDIRNNG
ncbi:MAG: hypothetical protein K2N72_11920 [Oscillospiraceae bacterium]|nr:hypothetical protein [Oscillospiraceae bacterium]